MQRTSKKAGFIIICTIFTFLVTGVLSVLFAFIQGVMLIVLILLMIITFWINPVFVIAEYFFVKKRIENHSKQGYTDVEWTLIKLNIILAQLAGVTMAHWLAICVHKDFFMITYGGFGLRSVDIGMGVTLVVMLLVTSMKDFYPMIKTFLSNKKEREVITGDKGLIRNLIVLIVVMLALAFTGFLLGKWVEQHPTLEELVWDKAESFLENKDNFETIREYIENLDYEKIMSCDEVENLNVDYFWKDKTYVIFCLNTQEVLDNIGLTDMNILEKNRVIRVEFDSGTCEIRKINFPLRYDNTGRKNLAGEYLIWYSLDYPDKPSECILDDNWQIEWLE